MTVRAVGKIGPAPPPPTLQFIAFTFNAASRVLAPFLYNADGTPTGGTPLTTKTLALNPAIIGTQIYWCKRVSGNAYVIVLVIRSGIADDTMTVYDVTNDTWTIEVIGYPSGLVDVSQICIATETNDDFFYQAGFSTNGFFVRQLSVDLLTTDTVIAETVTSQQEVYHLDATTIGAFASVTGAEITLPGGGITNPTAYNHSGGINQMIRGFPSNSFLGVTVVFRTISPLPYEIVISGADVTQVARFSGWVPSDDKSVFLNDAKNAVGIFPFDQTASPPSESFDWITALPKTAQHVSSVEIRPTDYISPGSPGTLAALPDAVLPLGAEP